MINKKPKLPDLYIDIEGKFPSGSYYTVNGKEIDSDEYENQIGYEYDEDYEEDEYSKIGVVDEENGWDEYSPDGRSLIHHPGRKERENILRLEEDDRLRTEKLKRDKEAEYEWQKNQETSRTNAINREYQRQKDAYEEEHRYKDNYKY